MNNKKSKLKYFVVKHDSLIWQRRVSVIICVTYLFCVS